jgi:hypothetical protein
MINFRCQGDVAAISGSTITNIVDNGYTVYYDAASCTALNGQTYNPGRWRHLDPGK